MTRGRRGPRWGSGGLNVLLLSWGANRLPVEALKSTNRRANSIDSTFGRSTIDEGKGD